MATVLTVHVIDTIWSRRRNRGLVAPFLVVDHNGEQQQTEVKKASTTTTAWNQKATFAYAPTSDLVIMAFDALGHDGDFLGQAVVDVAAMLQEGRLHARASIMSSAGRTVGEVTFEIALSTSSSTLAASLDIPCLTVSEAASKVTDSKSHTTSAFQIERLSDYSSPFAASQVQTGHIRQHQHTLLTPAPRVLSANLQAADLAEASMLKPGQKRSGLAHILGLNIAKRNSSEGGLSSPAKPATPASVMAAASKTSMENSSEFPVATGPLLARHSMLRSSQCSSSGPSAPPATASINAAQSTALQTAVQAATAAGGESLAAEATAAPLTAPSVTSEADVPRNLVFAPVQQRHSHASDTISTISRSSALDGVADTQKASNNASSTAAIRDVPLSPKPSQPCRVSQVPRLSVPAATPKAVDGPLSPLRSNRAKLNLMPKQAPLSPHERRMQRQQQLQRDLERLQHMVLQEAAVHPVLQQGCEYDSTGLLKQCNDVSGCCSEDDLLLQEYQTAEAAGREEILYKQLMIQQPERKAGSAQVLRLLAAQQQQEAMHEAQLLASLSSMNQDSSVRRLNASGRDSSGYRIATAAVVDDGDRVAAWSGRRSHYPEIPVPCSPVNFHVRGSQRQAVDTLGDAACTGGSNSSSADGSSVTGPTSERRGYPEVPAGIAPQTGHLQSKSRRGSRKQWAKPSATEHSGNSEVWQSCESASESASPTSSRAQSKTSTHAADRKAALPATKRVHGQRSRLVDSDCSKLNDLRSYPVMESQFDRQSTGTPAAFSCVRNLPADVPANPRWCDFPTVDAVSCGAAGPVYPFNAVAVEPSAPPA